jgi:hypothetical protein
MRRPLYVALCGAPQSGKTTLAEYLAERYGAVVVDDGAVLRDAARALYGLELEDVTTQAGKARIVRVCGKDYTVRQLLGELGNLLEARYGDQVIPELTLKRLHARGPHGAPFYVFPSVRKNQGLTYIDNGGVVIEVDRPGHVPVNDFDRYERDLIEDTVFNTGSLFRMFQKADLIFRDRLGFEPLPGLVAA